MHFYDDNKTKIEKVAGTRFLLRGFEYVKEGKVSDIKQIGENLYTAKVKGSSEKPYEVTLDDEHITKSTCNCPYCEGHPRRICKHKVALYYSVHKDEYNNLKNHLEKAEEERIERNRILNKQRNFKEAIIRKLVDELVDNLSLDEIKTLYKEKLFNEYINLYSYDNNISHNYDNDEDYSESDFDEYEDDDFYDY